MPAVDWFRQRAWREENREEFWAGFARVAGIGERVQCLRIQARYLVAAERYVPAAWLLGKVFKEHPDEPQLAPTHYELACIRERQWRMESAVAELRLAIEAERAFPSVSTRAWLALGRIAAEHGFQSVYLEFFALVDERCAPDYGHPDRVFRGSMLRTVTTALALMHGDLGDASCARTYARTALDPYLTGHPRGDDESTRERLVALSVG